MLKKYLEQNLCYFRKYKVKINFIGELQELPINLKEILIKSSNQLSVFKKLTLNVAINYSSKIEILNSLKILLKKRKKLILKTWKDIYLLHQVDILRLS